MDSSMLVSLVTMAEVGAKKLDIIDLLGHASLVVIIVLLLLLAFSFISWYIIGYKFLYLRKARQESNEFLEAFWQSKRLDAIFQMTETMKRSPISQVFKAGYIELSKLKSGESQGTMGQQLGALENVERALKRAANNEVTNLEKMIPFLATTGSTAPFVGLFGTVWGIMNSFINIGSSESATLATVAPGIAEALIATAIGLVAAIPAVMAYNFFSAKIRVLSSEMDSFSADFLNIIKRHFLK